MARQSIQVADEGRRVAKADFAPRIMAEGSLLDFQQSAREATPTWPLGFIKLEWGLFEGGKRVAEMRITDSKIRAAVAQAETIADTIAFQVTEAYRNLVTARLGIDHSSSGRGPGGGELPPGQRRAKQGDATSAEITDAESTLTQSPRRVPTFRFDSVVLHRIVSPRRIRDRRHSHHGHSDRQRQAGVKW